MAEITEDEASDIFGVEDDECGGEHCGNDCGGWRDEAGDTHPAEECVHCGCCGCTPCCYARVA